MANFDVIILAAGLSRRMGQKNKLLLDVGGIPMIAHVVRTYLDAISGPVTVVTGHDASAVKGALSGLPVQFLHNAQFEEGQQTSVVCGLQRAGAARASVLGLGDQPLLSTDDLTWLMDAFATAPDKLTIPVTDGKRGNPIVIPADMRTAILAHPTSPGCRTFSRANPEAVRKVVTARAGFFTDIDEPEDYTAFLQGKESRHDLAL